LKVDLHRFMTTLPGVFAAGDIVRGASLVVWAVRDGRDAAAQMHQYMQQAMQQSAAVAVAAE
jgi:glutamate synthase (NADPH/NADH) small chain